MLRLPFVLAGTLWASCALAPADAPHPALVRRKPSAPASPAVPRPRPDVCRVRWATDDATVAVVRSARLRVTRVSDHATTAELEAPADVELIDVSMPWRSVLRWRAGHDEIVPLEGGPPEWTEQLHDASFVGFSDDGRRAYVIASDGSDEPLSANDLPEGDLRVVNLATGCVHDLPIPAVSAGGPSDVAIAIRRRAIRVAPNRTAAGFFDGEFEGADQPAILRAESCWGVEGREGKGKLFGVDVDAEFRTAIVARTPCEEDRPKPRLEILRRALGADSFEVARRVALPGGANAIWLSPDGERAIVRSRRGAGLVNRVYDTRSGAVRGTVLLGGTCFEFSNSGRMIAEANGVDVIVRTLP